MWTDLLSEETRINLAIKARMNGHKILWLGAGLCVFGAVAPWLMILRIIPTSYLLCFLTYAAIVLGMALSFVGILFSNTVDLSK